MHDTTPRAARPEGRPLRTRRAAIGVAAAIGVLGTAVVGVPAASAAPATTIRVDGASEGRPYDGVGAVSGGGATSRLLLDYPEPERSEVLDYLFLPGYGAALEMLKVEVGGDTNSTDGSESSHMHEAGVVDCTAGYEWWLMQEAVERNPEIELGGLAWGAPGWIQDAGGYYSEATIDYFLEWLGCADGYGLTIDNMGIRNERHYEIDWILDFRAALDANGYEDVRIVASDEAAVKGEWPIAVDMANDPALFDAVDVLGNHYSQGPSSAAAQALGKPLWISEGGPWSAEWGAGGPPKAVPSLINNAYLRGRITGVQFWNLLTAYYDGLSISDAGLMRSNTPWSGAYQVQSAIWTVAHTTQFVEPGWQHLDTSSDFFAAGDPSQGSYVTRRATDSGDWSTVIERIGTTAPQTVVLDVTDDLVQGDLHVWQSTEDAQFVQQADLVPAADGTYSLEVPADSVVTVTTTSGQGRGDAQGRVDSAFPFPYADDLSDGGPSGQTPYLSQMEGAYEIRDCEGGRDGTCLTQVAPQPAISWAAWKQPATIIGDMHWTDYRVSVDAFVPEDGTAQVLGRVTNDAMQPVPNGYGVSLSADGTWSIGRGELGGKAWVELASGAIEGGAGWHRLGIAFDEERIVAEVDGVEVGAVEDGTWDSGMAGLGGDYARVQFADLAIEPLVPLVAVDDAAAAAEGSWTQCGDARGACGGLTPGAIRAADDGTVHASRSAGDVLELAFEGTQATLAGLTGPRGGTAAVSIDGNEPVSLTFAAQGANGTLEWRSPVLTDGAHTLRVEVTSTSSGDRGWVAIDGIDVVAGNGGPSSIDDQVEGVGIGAFDYRGDGWLSCPGCINRSQLYHSSVTSTGTAGDSVSLRFVGTSIDLRGMRASNQGVGEVRIDGEVVGQADFRGNPRLGDQLIWESAELAAGEHELTITAVAGGGQINVDRVVVHP